MMEDSPRVMIVTADFIGAVELENVIERLGYDVIGLAEDRLEALELAPDCDIALVDIYLNDGRTGPSLAQTLAEQHAVSVLFLASWIEDLHGGFPGALGALASPYTFNSIQDTLNYASARRLHHALPVPAGLTVFQ
uniref:Response regulator n=1 Tax=Rhizobium rhizogenes TaxID=359 RepID=A0A7S4ZS64_RHIRH|nr:response regulator [Rhizobium rhizogenes]QCL10002.1 response regulator [Rhizobium rhizogenes]